MRVNKLVYAPGETGEATVFLGNYAGREQSVRLRLVAKSGIHDERIIAERDITLPATPALQAVTVSLPALPKSGYQLRAEVIEDGKPTRVWLLGVERQRPFVEAVVARTRRNDGREAPFLERLCEPRCTASSEPLPLEGNTVRVPEVSIWGIVAVECEGPAADALPSDVRPRFSASKVPDINAPIKARKASEWEFATLDVRALAGGDRKKIVPDTSYVQNSDEFWFNDRCDIEGFEA